MLFLSFYFDCQVEASLRGRDLNPRPAGYGPAELPGCSTPRCWGSTPFYRVGTVYRKNVFFSRGEALCSSILATRALPDQTGRKDAGTSLLYGDRGDAGLSMKLKETHAAGTKALAIRMPVLLPARGMASSATKTGSALSRLIRVVMLLGRIIAP